MSRSEHATRHEPRDPGDLHRKRRIKELVDEERARPRSRTPTIDAAAVPIVERDRGRFVHYPASVDDLRAILARVPDGAADGLGEIELCLDERKDTHGHPVDPFVGRLTGENGVAEDLALLRDHATTQHDQRGVQVVECLFRLRRGSFAEAHAQAVTALAARQAPEAIAVRFEAAHHLGLPCDAEPLLAVLPNLRHMGYRTWADRLEALASSRG